MFYMSSQICLTCEKLYLFIFKFRNDKHA